MSKKTTAKAASAPKVKKPGKCAVIDALLLEGKHTLQAIWERVKKQFPEARKEPTLSTIRSNCYKMHAKGKNQAGWVDDVAA